MASLIPAVGYIRVSKTNGRVAKGDSFISPKVQRTTIENEARGRYRIVEWLEEHDVSGTTNNRPEFQKAIGMIERGEAKAMIVARLSRFARSAQGSLESLNRLEAAGGALIAADLGVDTSKPGGKFVRTVFSAMAELEADLVREQFLVAREQAVERGLKLARYAPLGYRFKDAKRDRRLVIDEETAPLVRELFQRKAEGAARNELIDWYHGETGVWITPARMNGIFRNRTYLGEVHSGKFANLNAHDPLVTPELFERARDSRLAPPRKARTDRGSLLAGVLTCSGCGRPMTYSVAHQRGRAVYRCQRRSAAGICPAPVSVVAGEADAYVEAEFLKWAAAQEAIVESVGDEHADALNAARLAHEQAIRERDTWRDMPVADLASPQVYLDGLANRQEAVDAAADAIAEIHAQGHRERLSLEIVDEWRKGNVPLEGKRRVLKAVAIATVAPSGRVGPGPWLPVPERITLTFRDR